MSDIKVRRFPTTWEPTFDVQSVLERVGSMTGDEVRQATADYKAYLEAHKAWRNRPKREVHEPIAVCTFHFNSPKAPSGFANIGGIGGSEFSRGEDIHREDEELHTLNEDQYTRSGLPKALDTIIKEK